MQMVTHARVCPECGARIGYDDRFCPACGAPQPEAPDAASEFAEAGTSESDVFDEEPQTAVRTDVSIAVCPCCQGRISADDVMCPHCHKPVYITTFNSVYDLNFQTLRQLGSRYEQAAGSDPTNVYALWARGACELRLRRYTKAERAFSRIIGLGGFAPGDPRFSTAEVYLYHAASLIAGREPSSVDLDTVDEVEDDIANGIAIEDIPGLYLLWALVASECLERRGLRSDPDSATIMGYARQRGASQADWERLNDLLFGR